MSSSYQLCTGVLVATDRDYQRTAERQLADADCSGPIQRVGQKTMILLDADPDAAFDIANTADGCTIQQLADVVAYLPAARTPDVAVDIMAALGESSALDKVSDKITVHLWSDDSEVHTAPVWHQLVEALDKNHNLTAVKSETDYTLSVCLGSDSVAVAVTKSKYLVSDWPGGMVRLAKRGRVSRSAMKLETALKLTGCTVKGIAADLGASPGSWTQVLREQGCVEVHAVDPNPLHEDVLADAGVIDYQQNAHRFLNGTDETFDVVTCDAKLDARDAAEVCVVAADKMKRNGLLVVTLRTSVKTVGHDVTRASDILEPHFERILLRQTSANRNEVTFVGRKL